MVRRLSICETFDMRLVGPIGPIEVSVGSKTAGPLSQQRLGRGFDNTRELYSSLLVHRSWQCSGHRHVSVTSGLEALGN
jgi:hypothetical protein